MNRVALYCRAGFEKECAAEISEKAARWKIYGVARIKENSGYVLFHCAQHEEADRLIREVPFSELIFARQMLLAGELLRGLPPEDRVSPIVSMLAGRLKGAGSLRVEVPDTNENKELLRFCRKLTVPLRISMRKQAVLAAYERTDQPVVHVFFIAPGCCYVGYSYPGNNSPFYMGIPRLKFPADGPSRSTLKLEEAFHVFIPADEWEQRLASGMHAVDLGACPGGWTYQLVKRSMMVHAVDSGAMAQSLLDTGQVIHHRTDGFKFKPERNNIYWLVCDMAEQPSRVTQLMTEWLLKGWCREVIFNLKLPMKKRYEAVSKNLLMMSEQLSAHHVTAQIQAKQLYHDREEVTIHVRRIGSATNFVTRGVNGTRQFHAMLCNKTL